MVVFPTPPLEFAMAMRCIDDSLSFESSASIASDLNGVVTHGGTLLPLHESNLANAGKGVKGNLGSIGMDGGNGSNAPNYRWHNKLQRAAILHNDTANSDKTGACKLEGIDGIASVAGIAG